ncbi:MAG: CinA family protein [Rhodobacteraceae bacterium]|nr:CinA family protein [Paracoccaceae bacterium]
MLGDTLADTLIAEARAAGVILATAESCTGGLLSGAITEVAGASDVFDRGFVTYSNSAKQDMLGVLPATLEEVGAVSEDVAREMALGAIANSGAGLAVAITGVAGPGGSAAKPEGRVCFAIARRGSYAWAETQDFGALGRAGVRAAAVTHALGLLRGALARETA